MPLSMYQASVPVFVHKLGNLSAILKKGEAFAAAKKIEPSILINARLAPDMFPLSRQVQIASDIVKGCVARLAGVEVPNYKDTETTFSELQARITTTINFVQSIKAAQIDGSEERPISVKVTKGELNFKGQAFLLDFVLPNFYFHISITYAILRHSGVEIGKWDYLGAI